MTARVIVVTIALYLGLGALVPRSVEADPIPRRCIAFSPYVVRSESDPERGRNPDSGPHPSPALIDELLDVISRDTVFDCIQTYGTINGLDYIFSTAHNRGLKVIAIIWLDINTPVINEMSIASAITAAGEFPGTIIRLSCGSELRTRNPAAVPAAEAVIRNCLRRLDDAGVTQPITAIDSWWEWCDRDGQCPGRDLAAEVGWIGVNVYPWWENRFSGLYPCTRATEAAQFTIDRLQQIRARFPDKEVILTEFGWPASGARIANQFFPDKPCDGATASQDNQRLVIDQTLAKLDELNLRGTVFEAFREEWKISKEGTVGPFWGQCEGISPYTCHLSIALRKFVLTVTRGGAGNGAVVSSPAAILCGDGADDCSERYQGGTSVTLSATAAPGSVFLGWQGGGCAGTGVCILSLTANSEITALFEPLVVTIVATDPNATEPAGTGTFTVTRTGPTMAALSVGYTVSGSATSGVDFTALLGTVTIPVGAASGSITVTPIEDTVVEGPDTVIVTLAGSPDYTVGSPGSATVTIADNDVAPVLRALTVAVRGSIQGGTAAGSGINCPGTCTLSVVHGTLVSLLATPPAGGTVRDWLGCDSVSPEGASLRCEFTMTADRAVTARFSKIFTNDPVVPHVTVIRNVHFLEVAQAAGVALGTGALPWLGGAGTPVLASQVSDLRTRLGLPAVSPGAVIRVDDLVELRTAVRARE